MKLTNYDEAVVNIFNEIISDKETKLSRAWSNALDFKCSKKFHTALHMIKRANINAPFIEHDAVYVDLSENKRYVSHSVSLNKYEYDTDSKTIFVTFYGAFKTEFITSPDYEILEKFGDNAIITSKQYNDNCEIINNCTAKIEYINCDSYRIVFPTYCMNCNFYRELDSGSKCACSFYDQKDDSVDGTAKACVRIYHSL